VLLQLDPHHFAGQQMETEFGLKLPTAVEDFPAAQFSGKDHLQKLWTTHDLEVSARSREKMGEKLQVRPFTSVFVIEYTFCLSISTVQTTFLLGINDTLLQSAL
jgi:hypothetical protein